MFPGKGNHARGKILSVHSGVCLLIASEIQIIFAVLKNPTDIIDTLSDCSHLPSLLRCRSFALFSETTSLSSTLSPSASPFPVNKMVSLSKASKQQQQQPGFLPTKRRDRGRVERLCRRGTLALNCAQSGWISLRTQDPTSSEKGWQPWPLQYPAFYFLCSYVTRQKLTSLGRK